MRDPFPSAESPAKAPTMSPRCSPPSFSSRRPRWSPRRSTLYLVALAALAATALVVPPALLLDPSTALFDPSPGPPQLTLVEHDDPDGPPHADAACLDGRCSRYSFDAAAPPLRPAWMSRLPDSTPLTALSIPGTHDTMTYGLARDARLRCQNWDLAAQLDAGLRYLDVRARLRDDELRVYHADRDTGFGLADVLLAAFAFLDANPSEAIVMRLKQEGPPVGANNTVSFEQAFVRYRDRDPRTAPGAARHLHPYDGGAPLPALGALRSSIFLLQDFAGPEAGPYGLGWDGPQMALEDMWVIPDIYHLADKWIAIRSAFERAVTDPLDNTRLYLAHISASVGVLPIDAAAGPRNRSVTGMNDMTAQWLLDFDGNPDLKPRVGVVIFDFPGRRAIDAVIAWNKVPRHRGRPRAP
ncbi:hypothetical protein G6O67_003431 [Ophiocordyceps sinensis]|uniref:Phosphatidylinositol-specific phospholipase C X domain-containing protein n=1 Tax=Ophiocordyceps sinensis TaxID=72228 RepID=A0A8H4V8I8_9HYPO|nr:hypothetical protein G6O67_003431 [Ophiocordyceps sinensis]